MTATLHLDADLRLEVDTGVAADDPGRRMAAHLSGTGSTLTLVLDGLDRLPVGVGYRQAADPVRDVAQLLADEGLTVVVATERGRLFSLGAGSASGSASVPLPGPPTSRCTTAAACCG